MGMNADPEGYNPEVNEVPSDPGARSYAEQVWARAEIRRASVLKGKAHPLGHVIPPPSEKMRAIADLHSAPVTESPFVANEKPEAPPPIRGVGGSYQVNQNISSGKTNGPVTLREGTTMPQQQRGFSEQTKEALRKVAEDSTANQGTREDLEEETPKSASPSVAEDTRSELDEAEKSFEPDIPKFDFAAIVDAQSKLMSKGRRDRIESRLKPLDIGDMVTKQELTQEIVIVPGKLSVTLRTFTQSENLWILKYVFDFPGSGFYVQELINTCRLACSLVAVNGAFLPDHRPSSRDSTKIVKEDFEKKLWHISSYPVQLTADFSIQNIWFQERVTDLLTLDELKNG
jgi:hypothetical protein